jgi:teichuronic acid biosynthesis glycosyltransferase TuaG
MNPKPLVSVIMPTYNHGAFIGDAISSVLAQTYAQLELIVVDNSSTDNTREVANSFPDDRVRYFQVSNSGIIAASRNFGARQARGEILAFLDSDDIWQPNKLAVQVPYLENGMAVCVGSDFSPIGDQLRCTKLISFAGHEPYRDLPYEFLVLSNPLPTSSVVVPRHVFVSCEGFDESRDFCFIEDWELWLRIAKLGLIRILSEPLIQYRIVRKKNRDEREVRLHSLRILEKHRRLGYLSGQLYATAFGNCCVTIGKAFLDVGDPQGVSYYMQGLKYSRGPRNKLRALAGLVLYQLPLRMRESLVSYYYRRQSTPHVH